MSDVEFHYLKNITSREFVAALLRDGFYLDRQKGSHQCYRHPDGRRVTVSSHKTSDTFPPKTLKSMIEQAGWTLSDLERLDLF